MLHMWKQDENFVEFVLYLYVGSGHQMCVASAFIGWAISLVQEINFKVEHTIFH